jgi:hypothetical protein
MFYFLATPGKIKHHPFVRVGHYVVFLTTGWFETRLYAGGMDSGIDRFLFFGRFYG